MVAHCILQAEAGYDRERRDNLQAHGPVGEGKRGIPGGKPDNWRPLDELDKMLSLSHPPISAGLLAAITSTDNEGKCLDGVGGLGVKQPAIARLCLSLPFPSPGAARRCVDIAIESRLVCSREQCARTSVVADGCRRLR